LPLGQFLLEGGDGFFVIVGRLGLGPAIKQRPVSRVCLE
jgi:hypothetical protein